MDHVDSHLIEISLMNHLQQLPHPGMPSPALDMPMLFAFNTSLDLHALLDILLEHIQIEGLIFQNQHHDLHIHLGQPCLNQINYHLSIGEHSLGYLYLMRKKAFTTDDLQSLRQSLLLFLLPLKNALEHHQALQLAILDPLTGAMNRSTMNATLSREIDLADRYKTPLTILALDLDDFKKVNDQHGHAAGDLVLKNFTKTLRETIRDSDMVFRTGGEEFITVLSKTDAVGAQILAERICKRTSTMVSTWQQHPVQITVSIGGANYAPGTDGLQLLEQADKALYQSKKAGKNCYHHGS